MPDATPASFGLENKSPQELEQRRREIVLDFQTNYKGYDDPEIPMSKLTELAVVTSMLRRKNAGPPKAAPAKRGTKTPTTVDDLLA